MTIIIAVDFDGTVVTHEYPDIGSEIPNCVTVLRRLNKSGAKLILWTMRSNEFLQSAIDWFAERDIELWAVNENPQQKSWTESPKAYAQLYIDDAALGCPLQKPFLGGRNYADWYAIEKILEEAGYLQII